MSIYNITAFDEFIINLSIACALSSFFLICFLSYYFIKLVKQVKILKRKIKILELEKLENKVKE